MRKLLVLLFTIPVLGVAQTSNEEIDYYQSIFGMGKKEVVSQLITLDADKADAFWKLYGEYEMSRKELGKERIALLTKYADNYSVMEASELKSLMMESMSLSEKNEKLIKSFYKRIEKQVDPITAAQFYQVESYLLSEIRAEIFGNIPMVEKIKG